jgi:NTP pyrophosphatase (non-canonical NTP hydrolase)
VIPLEKTQSLEEVQRYVADMEVERGFSQRPVIQQCLLLGEEIGELFKAVRKHEHLQTNPNSKIGTVEEELADVLIYICAIANRLDISLDEALRRKEEINEQRSWV